MPARPWQPTGTTPAGRRAGAAASCGGEHRAMVTLASLTMAGCARYPGAAGHLIRTAHIAACPADLMALDATLQQRIRPVTPCMMSASWRFQMRSCSSPAGWRRTNGAPWSGIPRSVPRRWPRAATNCCSSRQ